MTESHDLPRAVRLVMVRAMDRARQTCRQTDLRGAARWAHAALVVEGLEYADHRLAREALVLMMRGQAESVGDAVRAVMGGDDE